MKNIKNHLPDQIVICGIKYKIVCAETVNKEELERGEIDYMKCQILIDKTMPQDLQVQTLIHEVLHAVFDLTGNTELAADEKAVQGIATALYCILTQNRYLVFRDAF